MVPSARYRKAENTLSFVGLLSRAVKCHSLSGDSVSEGKDGPVDARLISNSPWGLYSQSPCRRLLTHTSVRFYTRPLLITTSVPTDRPLRGAGQRKRNEDRCSSSICMHFTSSLIRLNRIKNLKQFYWKIQQQFGEVKN